MVAFLLIYLLIGPAIVLAIWMSLRAQRQPVSLVEPMEIGRVMSGAFDAFRHWQIVLPAFVVVGGTRGVEVWVRLAILPHLIAGSTGMSRPAFSTIGFLAGAGMGWVGSIVRLIFYMPAIYGLIRYHEGEVAPWHGALAATARRYFKMFAVTTLGFVGGFVGVLLFIVPALIFILNWAVVLPVGMVERGGVFEIFRRSRELAVGSRGRMLIVYLVFGMIALVMTAIVLLVGRLGGVSFLVKTIFQVLLAIPTVIMGVGLQSSLYVELRRIRDGLSAPGLAEVFA